MTSTTFAERTGRQPARARVGACVQVARPFAVDAAAAVGLRLPGVAYRTWQIPAIGLFTAHGDHATNAISTMSTKCRTRTLGTRTT